MLLVLKLSLLLADLPIHHFLFHPNSASSKYSLYVLTLIAFIQISFIHIFQKSHNYKVLLFSNAFLKCWKSSRFSKVLSEKNWQTLERQRSKKCINSGSFLHFLALFTPSVFFFSLKGAASTQLASAALLPAAQPVQVSTHRPV